MRNVQVSIASNHSGLLESTIFLIDDDEPVWEDVGTNRAHSTRVLIIEDTSTDERAWTCPLVAAHQSTRCVVPMAGPAPSES